MKKIFLMLLLLAFILTGCHPYHHRPAPVRRKKVIVVKSEPVRQREVIIVKPKPYYNPNKPYYEKPHYKPDKPHYGKPHHKPYRNNNPYLY